jgi:hypothetical protein
VRPTPEQIKMGFWLIIFDSIHLPRPAETALIFDALPAFEKDYKW